MQLFSFGKLVLAYAPTFRAPRFELKLHPFTLKEVSQRTCNSAGCLLCPCNDREFDSAGLCHHKPAVSPSCLSNGRKIAQPYRCRASGATGANDYTSNLSRTRQEL